MANSSHRGGPPLRLIVPLALTCVKRSPSPPRDATVDSHAEIIKTLPEEQHALCEEQLQVCEVQQQERQDLTRLSDTVHDIAAAMARLEKRLTEVEAPVNSYQSERVPPPPPLRADFPHVMTTPPIVGFYDMPAHRMPAGVPFLR